MSQETEDSLARLCKRQGEKIAALQSEVAALREVIEAVRDYDEGGHWSPVTYALAKLDEGRKP